MPHLNPEKLHVKYMPGVTECAPKAPRCYTLTHSDSTGDLFLSIGQCFDVEKISKLYTRFMRDEVLAELKYEEELSLNMHYHVSGGFVFGTTWLRYRILRRYVSYNIQAILFGDKPFFEKNPEFSRAHIVVHFHYSNNKYEKTKQLGIVGEYKI